MYDVKTYVSVRDAISSSL